MYEIMKKDPREAAMVLAPSDRVAVIRRLTGVTVPLADSWKVLMALGQQDYLYLMESPLREYFTEKLDPLTVLLIQYYQAFISEEHNRKITHVPIDWEALQYQVRANLALIVKGKDPLFLPYPFWSIARNHCHYYLVEDKREFFLSLLGWELNKYFINTEEDAYGDYFSDYVSDEEYSTVSEQTWTLLQQMFNVDEETILRYLYPNPEDGFGAIFG